MRTQVGIIGAGPAGLFLSLLLKRSGIESVILEARSRDYVEGRVRAGVLESGTVDLMRELGVNQRLEREAMIDRALDIRFSRRLIHLDLPDLTGGKVVTVYGQQEVVKDLIAARLASLDPILFEAEAVGIDGVDGERPAIHYLSGGEQLTLQCDVIAGCDGFHGVCRTAILDDKLTTYDRVFPFGWLGILSHSPPIAEMTYANHERGFALCSRRSPQVSRHYVQFAADDDPASWSDAQFWDELDLRMNDEDRSEIVEGEIFQKDVARLRAFVASPMQYGRLFLAGDAAHIVPPTGAKGLNLAVADVRVLARALEDFFGRNSRGRLDRYTDTYLQRVWKAVRYSTYMTSLLHRFETHTPFERQFQLTELAYLLSSRAAQTAVAKNYVGFPFVDS